MNNGSQCSALEVPVASNQVVVGKPGGLHEGLDRRRTDGSEPSSHHVFTNALGLGCLDWDFVRKLVLRRNRFVVVYESPNVLVERTKFPFDLQKITYYYKFTKYSYQTC